MQPSPILSLPTVPTAAVPTLRKALWRHLQARLLDASGPPECPEPSELHWKVLAQLVPFARPRDLAGLMNSLPDVLQAPGNFRRYKGLGETGQAWLMLSWVRRVCSWGAALPPPPISSSATKANWSRDSQIQANFRHLWVVLRRISLGRKLGPLVECSPEW